MKISSINALSFLPLAAAFAFVIGCGNNGGGNHAQQNIFTITFRETNGPQKGSMNYTLQPAKAGITPGLQPSHIDIFDYPQTTTASPDSIEFWLSVNAPLHKGSYRIDDSASVTLNDDSRGLFGNLPSAGVLDITEYTQTRAAGNFNFCAVAPGHADDTICVNGSFDLMHN